MSDTILSSYFQPPGETHWKRSSNFVYRVQYHLILFTPKYRPIITSEISIELVMVFKEITDTKGYDLYGLVIHSNHVHLILGAKPTHFIPNVVKDIRERTSFLIIRRHGNIQKEHRVKKLWSRNFGVETLGDSNIERMKDCLQDPEEHSLIDEWEESLWRGKKEGRVFGKSQKNLL